MEEPLAFGGDGEDAIVGQSGPHQRSAPRDSMFLNSTIHRLATDETWPLRVRNLSSGGLMAECAGAFATGDEVELDVRGIGVQKGIIAWTVDKRIGVAFERPINPLLARRPIKTRRAAIGAKAKGPNARNI